MDSSNKPKLHYAWIVCLCGLWLLVCNMGLTSNILSVYLPFIEAEGLSHSMGSAILSIRCLFSFGATFLVELYYRKLSLRRGILLASLIGVAAAAVYAIGGGAFVYYTGAALGGVCYGLGAVYPVSLLLTNWFRTHKGLAVGVSFAGSGVASMAFSPVVSALAIRYGLGTTFLVQAAFMLLSAIVLFLLLRDDPAQKGLRPYGEGSAEGKTTARAENRQTPSALPALVLGMLALMMLLIGGGGQMFSGHLSVLSKSCGYSAQAAAAVVSLQGLVLVASKFLAGGMADRIGPKRCTTLLMAVFILGCLLVQCMDGVSRFWCYAPVALMGFGAAFYTVGPTLWAGELTDKAGYPKLLKWLQIFYNLGGILLSAVPGIIADRTGEYKSSYLLIAGMMATSLLILRWSYWRSLKKS